MALLAVGGIASQLVYKHDPPGVGGIASQFVYNMALLAEGPTTNHQFGQVIALPWR